MLKAFVNLKDLNVTKKNFKGPIHYKRET